MTLNDTQPIIVVKDLVKKFGSFTANDHLTFSVSRGEVFGFLGANGAGKTTAIRILCGLLKATSGQVSINGVDTNSEPERVKRMIGYMSQQFSLYTDLTVEENIRLFGGIYGLSPKEICQRSGQLLKRLNVIDLRNRLIATIPLGWKQKLAFSIAILHRPAVVFLDEPTGGVDPITRKQFWELIYEAGNEGITVFVTTHYMDEAEYCDRVCILAEGAIQAIGTPESLKKEWQVTSMDDLFIRIASGN